MDKYSKHEMEAFLDELEARYADVELDEDSPSVEEILSRFDDNGNWICNTQYEDNIDELLRELEERYAGIDVPEELISIEEILEMYDDNGNKKEKEEHNSEDVLKKVNKN